MDILSVLTNELKDVLSNAKNESEVENIIFEHIRSAEEKNYDFPDFPSGLDWFNVNKPLNTSMLKNKIVVVDFFTYCCINCLHVIPHLREVEIKYPDSKGLVVIGVHSAKFDNEKDSSNLLAATKRYNISHPVCNDTKCTLWNKLNISCWPTILIIGPGNKILFCLIGEGHNEEMLLYIETVMKYYKNRLSTENLPIIHSDKIVKSSLLDFPVKITRWQDQFAVSDCGLHRILIFNKDSVVKYVIGGKSPGFKDGNFQQAKFNSPQGLAFYDSNTLYIADTENHAIRLAKLKEMTVSTVVGNGSQGKDYVGGKCGTEQEISSPWDICIVPCSDADIVPLKSESKSFDGHSATVGNPLPVLPPPPMPVFTNTQPFSIPPPLPPRLPGQPNCCTQASNTCPSRILLIAAAGIHQIWAFFIEAGVWWKGKKYEKNVCLAVAGTGREENRNNCYPNLASFAQPSGLVYSEKLKAVFVADSESSSIRKISTKNGSVTHVVGGNRAPDDLFSYGDIDGKGYKAKLQHPLGIGWNPKEQELIVCDSYNHKIKVINPVLGTCKTLQTNQINFNEPNGCCLDDSADILYVCDTNNGDIKFVNLTDNVVKKLELKEAEVEDTDTVSKGKWQETCFMSNSGGSLKLNIEFTPKDLHGRWKLHLKEPDDVKVNALKGSLTSNIVILVMEFPPSEQDCSFSVEFELVFCGAETCNMKKEKLDVTLKRINGAKNTVTCNINKNLI